MITDDDGIAPYVYPDGTPYFIYWQSISTELALQEWLDHLRKKVWWTEAMEDEFVQKVRERLT